MQEQDAWEIVGEFLASRRVDINPEYKVRNRWTEYTEPLGLSARIVRDIEAARRHNFKLPTLTLIEKIYKLDRGWLLRAVKDLREGKPLPPAPFPGDPRPLVDPTEPPPSRAAADPDRIVHIVGHDPLEPDEELHAWPAGEGQTTYEFHKTSTGIGPVQIRLERPDSEPLSSVVERFRNIVGDISGT